MDPFEIEPNLLDDICILFLRQLVTYKEKFNTQSVHQIIEWNQALQPSFNLLKSILNAYFAKDNLQPLRKAVINIPHLIVNLQENKCPKNFIRAFLAIVKNNLEILKNDLDWNNLRNSWRGLNPELVEYYFDTF